MQKYLFKGYQELLGIEIPVIEMIQSTGKPIRVMLGTSFEAICGLNRGGLNQIIRIETDINFGHSIINVIEDEEFMNLVRDNNLIPKGSISKLQNLYILKEPGCSKILRTIRAKTKKAKQLTSKNVRAEYFSYI